MRYAIVNEGIVVNIILWDGEEDYLTDAGELIAAPDEVTIGWTWEVGEWVAPPAAEPAPEPEVEPEAPEVTAAKETALQELVALGVTEATARTIVGLPEAPGQ